MRCSLACSSFQLLKQSKKKAKKKARETTALSTIVLCFTNWMRRTSKVLLSVSLMFLAHFDIPCDL